MSNLEDSLVTLDSGDSGDSGTQGSIPYQNMRLSPRRLKRRQAAEWRFKFYGQLAISIAILMLVLLLYNVIAQGYTAFIQTHINLEVTLDPAVLGTDPAKIGYRDLEKQIHQSVYRRFPEVTGRRDRAMLRKKIVSRRAYRQLFEILQQDPALLGRTAMVWLPADDEIDLLAKNKIDLSRPESDRPVGDQVVAWYRALVAAGEVKKRFNGGFFTHGSSRAAEQAGIWHAVVGSFWMMVVTLCLSFPIGVAAALFLEEFASPSNRWAEPLEVNLNNLAAVPSIVFGLLGAVVLLDWLFPEMRGYPVIGGMVLALMTLPTIVITTRAALRSVPPSIREGALAMGASRMQTVLQQVLPLAVPGILTGTIIGMARALGETAPLLMIGMKASGGQVATSPFQPATALPVQILEWAEYPERAFVEKSAGAILVLLAFLISMNLIAVLLRRRFEYRL